MDIIAIFMLIFGALGGGAVVRLYLVTERRLQDQERRIAELERASDKRHLPYKTAESIEDATTAILKAMREIEFDKSLLDNALGHLKNARNNK